MASILVIDDEESIRLILRKVLEGSGHHVEEASNGVEGLALIKEKRFDLVFLDVVMPEKGGLETLMEIHARLPDTKAIVISGKIDLESEAFRNFTRLFGGTRTLKKPFHLATVIREVEEALDLPHRAP
jgi:DNA-binding NtrC family response regulator